MKEPDTTGTPLKDSENYSDDESSSSPRSFTTLMSHIETHDRCGDDVSVTSLQSVYVQDRAPGALERANADVVFDDGQGSLQSGKTSKTTATASTQPLSLSLSQPFIATTAEDHMEEGTTYFLEPPRIPQHHNGGYSRLSSNLQSFDDLRLDPGPVVLLGFDLSHLSSKMQFITCASGVFGFSLLYGYLQELISVHICNRQLGLFLSMMQFTVYTMLSYILRTWVNRRHDNKYQKQQTTNAKGPEIGVVIAVPLVTYLCLSLLRAVELAMTNLAMQYINYPAKTLIKSSRVIFTMIFGVLILRKKYLVMDYFIVLCMCAGLAIFMHADATSSAVFQPLGVIMLTISLLCDGAITNMSETIMTKHGVGQDEFIFRLYSIALVAITVAAAYTGDLYLGLSWMFQPGTYDEVQRGVRPEDTSWSMTGKVTVIIIFSCMGLLSSSCSAAITKHFGGLAMSITSTTRKATSLFLSFFVFNNVCTFEHIVGVIIFTAALVAKSLRSRKDSVGESKAHCIMEGRVLDMELLHPLKSEVLHKRRNVERTPNSTSRRLGKVVSSPNSSFYEPQHRFEPAKHHLTRPMERGSPIGPSQGMVNFEGPDK